LFRVVDKAGYLSAFYCVLNTQYRIVSYRNVYSRCKLSTYNVTAKCEKIRSASVFNNNINLYAKVIN